MCANTEEEYFRRCILGSSTGRGNVTLKCGGGRRYSTNCRTETKLSRWRKSVGRAKLGWNVLLALVWSCAAVWCSLNTLAIQEARCKRDSRQHKVLSQICSVCHERETDQPCSFHEELHNCLVSLFKHFYLDLVWKLLLWGKGAQYCLMMKKRNLCILPADT